MFDDSLRSILSTGQGNTIEFDLPGPNGVRHFVADATPEFDENGRVASVLTSSHDVTDAKRAEEGLRAMNDELRRANEDLNQFAYSASHDLQEPLRMVAVYSQLLARKYAGKLDEQADEYISYTIAGAHRMEILVRDLLAYTKAVSISDLPKEGVDANAVLQNVIANLRGAIEDSAAELVYGELPCVKVHDIHLVQLLQNIISNATKYRRPERPRIVIGAAGDGECWRFSVSDNGVGIPAKYTEQVFGLFQRLYSAAEFPGTGIGLALCRRIVERYGGKIWVESEVGRGSTFYFTLPA
jgi:light-regulated signal transduction histidine kinase (bacteriophytochrome)